MTRKILQRMVWGRTRRVPQPRRLFLESLDDRIVLTGSVVPADYCESVEEEVSAAVVDEPTVDEPSSAVAWEQETLTADGVESAESMESDAVWAGEGSLGLPAATTTAGPSAPAAGLGPGGPGPGEPGGADPDEVGPTIDGFSAHFDSTLGKWIFSGTVLDNGPLNGLTVVIGGVVQGQAITGQDGSFALQLTLPPGLFGTVSATVTGLDGNPSLPVSIWLST